MIVGLTGGIASGKTLCSDWFAGKGLDVIDADVLAREVVMPGESGWCAVVEQFGKTFLQDNGALDRKRLRRLIFADQNAREQLDRILHPQIRARIVARLRSIDRELVILSAALLFENALDRLCAFSVVVDVPVSLQLARGAARDHESAAGIARIVEAQIPREKRLAQAGFIIDNSGEKAETKRQCAALYQRMLTLRDA